MKTLEKGKPGYIKARKMRYLLWAVLEFSVVAFIFILGIVQTENRMKLLTVVAVVGCLPASKMLVEFIAMAPHKGIDETRYQEICQKAPLLTTAYDLLLTCSEKNMPVEALVISGHVICGYASSSKTDVDAVALHIKQMLGQNHFEKMTVKIFHDYTAFLSRAEGLNNMASVSHEEGTRQERAIRKLILSSSM